MASTSHGHIGVSTIIPPTPEPQINYRAYEIKKFLSETNPGYITPGESKNNTIIYKSPSFAILSGAQKFEDSLLSYGGICFEGEIDVDPETIEVIEINQLNASEYGVAWSTSNPSLSLVSENNGNYHYELSISYTVSLSQSSSLDRVAAVNLNQDVSDWVPELGYDVWGVHGMYRYSTMSTGPDVYFGAKLELDGNLITVNPHTTVTESFTFYSDDFNITLPSGHQWIFQGVEWLNGEIVFEFKSGSTRATVTVIDSNLELEEDEPSTGYARWVYTVTLRIQNGSAGLVAVKGPYLPNDDVQFIDSKYGFVSGAFPVEVYADPAEPVEEDLAKPIRRGWVKVIVGSEIVDNKLMPVYANKRILRAWIGDSSNHAKKVLKNSFGAWTKVANTFINTSSHYIEYSTLISYNDELHIFGDSGFIGQPFHYKWDGDEWISSFPLPYDYSPHSNNAVVFNGELHLIGGKRVYEGDFSQPHYKWDGEQWVLITNSLPWIDANGGAFIYQNKIHSIDNGRNCFVFDNINNVWEIDEELQSHKNEFNTGYIGRGDYPVVYRNQIHIFRNSTGEGPEYPITNDVVWDGIGWSRSQVYVVCPVTSVTVLDDEIQMVNSYYKSGQQMVHYKFDGIFSSASDVSSLGMAARQIASHNHELYMYIKGLGLYKNFQTFR